MLFSSNGVSRIQGLSFLLFNSNTGHQGTCDICQMFVSFQAACGRLPSVTLAPRGGGSSEQSVLCPCCVTARLSWVSLWQGKDLSCLSSLLSLVPLDFYSKEKEISSRKDVASVVCLCKLLILGTRVRKSLMNQA